MRLEYNSRLLKNADTACRAQSPRSDVVTACRKFFVGAPSSKTQSGEDSNLQIVEAPGVFTQ
jgi:hypothetical protein